MHRHRSAHLLALATLVAGAACSDFGAPLTAPPSDHSEVVAPDPNTGVVNRIVIDGGRVTHYRDGRLFATLEGTQLTVVDRTGVSRRLTVPPRAPHSAPSLDISDSDGGDAPMLVADDRCLTELGKVVITAGAFAVATDALGVAIATGNVPAWPALLQAVVATSAAYSSAVNDYIACMQRV